MAAIISGHDFFRNHLRRKIAGGTLSHAPYGTVDLERPAEGAMRRLVRSEAVGKRRALGLPVAPRFAAPVVRPVRAKLSDSS